MSQHTKRPIDALVTQDILNGRPASSVPALFLLANGFDAAALRKAAEIYRGTDPVLADVLTEEAEARSSDGAVAYLGMVMGIPPRRPIHEPAPDAPEPLVSAAYAGAFSTYSDQVLAEIGDALTRRPSPAVIFNEWIAGATPGAAAVKLLGQGSLKARR